MAWAVEELAASASQSIQLVRNMTRACDDQPGPTTMRRASELESESKPAIGAWNQNWEAMTNMEIVTNTWVLARRGQASMPQALLPHWRLRIPRPQGAARGADIVFVLSGQSPRRRCAPKQSPQLEEHCRARSDLRTSPDHAIGSNHRTFAQEDLSVRSNRRDLLAHGMWRSII